MVKIAIAGASGEVAQEVIDTLVATNKHQLLLLSRKALTNDPSSPITTAQADYTNVASLTATLLGTHTLLSFITPQTDPGSQSQRNLIDACIAAGVKRFAPSEWAMSNLDNMPLYAGKETIRSYLAEINRPTKVLEYTLFQPGLFTNYLTHPHKSATHVSTFETQFDFAHRRAIVRDADGLDDIVTLTTAQDLARVVARAVEFGGEWPVVGGIQGRKMRVREILDMGERVRGAAFAVETVSMADLESGDPKTTWLPIIDHPAVTPEQARSMAGVMLAGMTLSIKGGAFDVSDEWNRLLPDYRFTHPETFLTKAWAGKE